MLEFTSTGTPTGSDISLGFRFTTNQAISVVALDAHVVNAAGSQVRLYDTSGTTLASATVLPTDPTEGSPTLFYSHAITPLRSRPVRPIRRRATTRLVILRPSGMSRSRRSTPSSPTAPQYPPLAWASTRRHRLFFSSFIHDGLFGPDFDIAAVPEPSTRVLVMAAMVFGPGSIGSATERGGHGLRLGAESIDPAGGPPLGSSG